MVDAPIPRRDSFAGAPVSYLPRFAVGSALLLVLMSGCSAASNEDGAAGASDLATSDSASFARSSNGFDLAITAAGKANVVYTPDMSTRNGVSFGSLRVATKTSNGWDDREILAVASAKGLASARLAEGPDGELDVAYANAGELFVADESPSGKFDSVSIDQPQMDDASGVVAIAIDGTGGEHLAYSLSRSPNEEIRYAHRTQNGTWSRELLEAIPGRKVHSPKIRVAGDAVHVVYESWQAETKIEIHHLEKDGAGAWSATNVGSGSNPALAIDPDGAPHIAFFDAEAVHHAVREPGRWNDEVVLRTDFSATQFHAWPDMRPGIDVDKDGTVHLAVVDVGPDESTLRYARKPRGGNFAVTPLLARADGEASGEYFFDAPSIAADTNGGVQLLYRNGQAGLVYRADFATR